MTNQIQFARGNFSKFIENLSSDIANPVPPSYTAQKAAEMLFQKYDISIDPEELRYQDGAFQGEFNVNVVNDKIREYLKESNATLDPDEVIRAFLAELDNTCREFNIKRKFISGIPFVNMDGDKVDLVISCGDGYLARIPMERMTIEKYIGLKNPSKNKIKPTDDTRHNWRKEIVDYLKEVKCQDSDEQQEVNGLIDTINSFNSDYSNTSKSTKINRDIGLDMMSEQLERFFKSLEDKNIKPIIYDHKIMLVRVEESESPDGISIRISATPSKDPETYIMSIFNKNFKTINLED